jgi:hypothetical protein
MCEMHAEIRRQADLQGLPEKETTRRMHEWPGFVHDWPIPVAKHFDLIKGLITGTRIFSGGMMLGRAQPGIETFAQAQIAACWSARHVLVKDQSGLMSKAQPIW